MSVESNSVKPLPIALLICDQVITDSKTNKKSLIGIFNSVAASQFPCAHPKMCIFASVTNGRGKADALVRCVNEDHMQQPPVFEASGAIEFPSPIAVIEMVFEIGNMVFERPGRYCMEFICDGDLILQKRFMVIDSSKR